MSIEFPETGRYNELEAEEKRGKGSRQIKYKEEVFEMKVGFIGLGIMGRPMSKNLIKAGYELVVNDFNRDAVADVVACGAEAATSNKEVGEKCDVVITMVQNSPQVRSCSVRRGRRVRGSKAGHCCDRHELHRSPLRARRSALS